MQLDQDKKSTEALIGLAGYKLACMTAKIQKQLQEDGQPSTNQDVYNELRKVNWSEADALKKTTVDVQLKVHKRVSPYAVKLLSAMESHFGNGNACPFF